VFSARPDNRRRFGGVLFYFVDFIFPHRYYTDRPRGAMSSSTIFRPLACRCSTAAHYFCACWLTATRDVFLSKNIYLEVALQPPPPPPPLSRERRRDDDYDNNNILYFNNIIIMCYRPVSYPKRVRILNIIMIGMLLY